MDPQHTAYAASSPSFGAGSRVDSAYELRKQKALAENAAEEQQIRCRRLQDDLRYAEDRLRDRDQEITGLKRSIATSERIALSLVGFLDRIKISTDTITSLDVNSNSIVKEHQELEAMYLASNTRCQYYEEACHTKDHQIRELKIALSKLKEHSCATSIDSDGDVELELGACKRQRVEEDQRKTQSVGYGADTMQRMAEDKRETRSEGHGTDTM